MIEIGRIVMKLAGRDAGKLGVIIKIIDDNYVLVDGEVRRRKCNITHVELLNKVVKISEDAPESEVNDVFKEIGFDLKKKKGTKKESKPRPRKVRKVKEKPVPKKGAKEEKKKEVKKTPETKVKPKIAKKVITEEVKEVKGAAKPVVISTEIEKESKPKPVDEKKIVDKVDKPKVEVKKDSSAKKTKEEKMVSKDTSQ